jgi:hypothetical protein
MAITPTSATIKLGTLLSQIRRGQICVNRTYQRSGEIWPSRAKSFLVETVLLKMPIPRVLLHVISQPNVRHRYDIIDGQQRCTILEQFRDGQFALTGAVDNASFQGKHFADLSAKQQAAFNSVTDAITTPE